MTDPEMVENFTADADLATSVQERHDEKRSVELDIQEFPTSEGSHDGQVVGGDDTV
jgi:hypothetical protein